MTFAGFNVPPEGGQGFGRRLPFGSSVLLDVTQAGSFSNQIVKSADRLHKGGGEVQWRGAPGSRALLSRLREAGVECG